VLEKLHRALMLFRLFAAAERAEVFAFAGPGINLARIEPILARLEFANHGRSPFFRCCLRDCSVLRLGTGSPGRGAGGSPGGGSTGSGADGMFGPGVGVPGSISGGKTGAISGIVFCGDMPFLPKTGDNSNQQVRKHHAEWSPRMVAQIKRDSVSFAVVH
jgi:hypothetical protein